MSCSEWKEYRLEEICLEITDGSHASPKSVKKGYPMASVKDMNYFDINIETCRQISEEDYNKLKKGNCKPRLNDVLIAKDGSYMKYVNVVNKEEDLVILSSIAILRPNINIVNPNFLKYYLLSPNVKLDLEQGYVSGSVIRRIVLKDFKRFPIKLPTLEEQEKISNILSSLDNKIKLNNEMNKTLEEIAQSIFKRWFIDFEFPNENGKPYKSSGGEMVESELGMIPKGWEVTQIDKISQVTMGVSPSSKTYNEENIGLPLLNGAADFEGKIIKPNKFTSEPKKICKKGDMVFGVRATIGNIVFADKEYALGRGVASIKINDKLFREFIYYSLENSMENLINNATGSVFLNLKKADIEDLKVCYSKNIVVKFNNIAKELIDNIVQNHIENQLLKQQREILLYKLLVV